MLNMPKAASVQRYIDRELGLHAFHIVVAALIRAVVRQCSKCTSNE